MSIDPTMTDKLKNEAAGQTHWEMNGDGVISRQQNTGPMNNDQQLRNDRQIFAQSLPIDKLAQYKDALATGNTAQMEKLRETLTPGQTKLLNEIEARDPMTMVRGLTNLAFLTGSIELAQGAAPGFDNFMNKLLDPKTNALSMSSFPQPTLPNVPSPTQGMDIKANPLMTPDFTPGGM